MAELAVPIVFVESSEPEWKDLKPFWTYTDPLAGKQPAAASLAAAPLAAGPLAPVVQAAAAGRVVQTGLDGRIVKIKVPLGLEKPATPAWNPPTAGKWELGKRLFFDDKNVLPAGLFPQEQSCAKCHIPEKGFTSGLPAMFGTMKTPTLINSAYNRHQFWDGRATALEEVVELKGDGERGAANADSDQRHSWGGIAQRLRTHPEYVARFKQVFGTPPTKDAVAKALATYIRTILSGDSLYDRAENLMVKRADQTLKVEDYLQALREAPEADVKPLWEDPAKKEDATDLSKRLLNGHRLFREWRCNECHSKPRFTDGSFHNLGIGGGETSHDRFSALPIGEKDTAMIGAFKTPTLRALPRTAPYMHDGSVPTLFDAVVRHVKVNLPQMNPHLDPLLRDDKDPSKPRTLEAKEADIRDVVLFLKALDAAPDPVVTARDQRPEGTARPRSP
jgi:cytochrome c peroxidase